MVFSKNIFSTAIKFQFAAQLKILFAKTFFKWKNHCLKGRQAVSSILFLQFCLVWATRTDVQLHTCKVASVKERIRSKLRTARKSKHGSKADKGRSNLAICRSRARALPFFSDTTLESGGSFWKSWKKKTKIAPFGRSHTCRVLGFFIALGLPGL